MLPVRSNKFSGLENWPAFELSMGVTIMCASATRCAQVSPLVIALTCMSAISCLVDAYLRRRCDAAKTSYNQSIFTRWVSVNMFCFNGSNFKKKRYCCLIDFSNYQVNSTRKIRTVNKLSKWQNLNWVIAINQQTIEMRLWAFTSSVEADEYGPPSIRSATRANNRQVRPTSRLRVTLVVGRKSVNPQYNWQVVGTIANEPLQNLAMGMMYV